MSLVYGRDAEVAAWVAAHIPHVGEGGFGPCTAIGVESNHRLIAGVVYHEWVPAYSTVQLSIAATSPMWARPQNINALLAYPFQHLNVFKIWTLVPADNARALKVNRHVGFRHEATLPHQFGPGRHADFASMLRADFDRAYGDSHG